MAKIPTHNSQLSLTREAPGVVVSPSALGADEARANQEMGQILSGIGQAISEVGLKIKKVRQEQEVGQASIEARNAINQMEWDASTDTDVQGFDEKYAKRAENIRTSLMSKFKDREAAQEFGMRLDMELSNSSLKIKQYGYKNLIDTQLATMGAQIQQHKEAYLNETNPTFKSQHLAAISSLYKKNQELGVISAKDAQANLAKISAELPEAQAEWDISQNPDYALEQLQKGKGGIYADLAIDKRAKFIEKAQKKIDAIKKDGEQLAIVAQNKREDELITASIKNEITGAQVKEDLDAGKISPRFAKAMISNLENPKIVPIKTDPTVFEEIMDMITNKDVKASAIREKLLSSVAEEKLSRGDMRRLYYMKQQGGDTTVYQDYQEEKKPKNWLQQSWETVKSWFHKDEDTQDRVDVMNLIMEDAEAADIKDTFMDVTKKAINKKILERNPAIRNVRKEGQIMFDGNGNKALVFPDGSFEEVE